MLKIKTYIIHGDLMCKTECSFGREVDFLYRKALWYKKLNVSETLFAR